MTLDEALNESNKIQLSNILMTYCQGNKKAWQVYEDMKNNPDTTVKDYVLALADGLKYGNWPWVEQHSTRELMNDHRFHNTSCPAYAGNEFQCNCGMVK